MRIVVGIGGETDIVPLASILSTVPELAEVHAVAVVRRHGMLDSMRHNLARWRGLLREAQRLEEEHAEEILEGFRALASKWVKDVHTVVLRGSPSRQLVSFVRREKADFIVVARTQTMGEDPSPLGHIASRVAVYAPCSVLVLNPLKPLPEVCLLATDGSPQAGVAATRLRNLMVRGRRRLLVCTIAPSFDTAFVQTGSFAYADYDRLLADVRENQRAAAQAIVDREASAFEGLPFEVRKLAYTGDPVSVLSRVVREQNVGLLAMGAKGLSAPSRFLLGSVTWRLLNRATCSILIGR